MSLQDIALPIDVPWKLVATSNDMLATHQNIFPNAMWRNSLAIFAFDPDLSDLPEEFKDRELTFLKVVASITSYSPCLGDPPPPPNREAGEDASHYDHRFNDWFFNQWLPWGELVRLAKQTLPCSGALVQVAIYPKVGDTTDVSQLAYFTAFEPQKRELIEVATESGEAVTQSKTNVDIRKGITSTDSTEDKNVFTGANLGVGFAGAKADVGVQGQWGTIRHTGTDHTDMTTSDASRESREQSSHTTSLSQLYHLLNSYHLGTNRAIFFLQPRPHTVQQKDQFTFIAGPQEIEGIQEFFLVVNRPKGAKIEDYCVDALLYTAHLDPEATRSAILEPKVAETPWQELWAASSPAKNTVGWSIGDAALIAAEIGFGIPPSAAAGAQFVMTNFVGQHPSDYVIKQFFNADQFHDPNNLTLQSPLVIDRYFYIPPPATEAPNRPASNLASGWRVDRTRGLGGYDLWENPNNFTATPLGYTPPTPGVSDTRPQASIEIVEATQPDDPDVPLQPQDTKYYGPDGALHVRVFLWPSTQGVDHWAMYHARIKVYFIRDDQTPDDRTIPMFVTARGVSTCGDSPFAQFYNDPELELKHRDVIYDGLVKPRNVAPWRNPPAPPPPTATVLQQGATLAVTSPAPIDSAAPSGYDHAAIGAAHAKMANSLADAVRGQLKASLTCMPDSTSSQFPGNYSFAETDFVFQRVARAVMASEVSRFAAASDKDSYLASYIASHPVVSILNGSLQPTAVPRPDTARAGGLTVSAVPLPPLPGFPALTLASQNLREGERDALQNADINSGLDLLNLPAAGLALRLGVSQTEARRLRLRAIGLSSGK